MARFACDLRREGLDPRLEQASKTGDAMAVRLARALQVQALAAAGRTEEMRQAITAHAASLESKPAHAEWRLLDQMGTAIIQHESDKTWTADSGHRTPLGSLGQFHAVEPPPATDDSLLDDLGDAPAGPPAAEPPQPTSNNAASPQEPQA